MEPFPANFCKCIVQINFKKEEQIRYKVLTDLFQKGFTSESSATKYALCALSRENTAKCTKTKFKIAIKVNKILILQATDKLLFRNLEQDLLTFCFLSPK